MTPQQPNSARVVLDGVTVEITITDQPLPVVLEAVRFALAGVGFDQRMIEAAIPETE